MSARKTYGGDLLLPAAPLHKWLTSSVGWVPALEFELRTGVSARIVFELRRDAARTVSLDTADRLTTLFTGSASTLNELYPVEAA
jgi:hypothetical protein